MVVPTRYNKNESVVSCIVREADKAWRSTGVIVLLVQTYSPWPRGKPVEVVGDMQVVYYYPIDTNHTNSLMTCKNLMSIKNIKQILFPIGEYNIRSHKSESGISNSWLKKLEKNLYFILLVLGRINLPLSCYNQTLLRL